MPVFADKELISFVQASSPPADAPIATMENFGEGGPRGTLPIECRVSGMKHCP